MGYGYMDHGFGFFGMGLFWIIILIALVMIIGSFFRKDARSGSVSAEEIVKNRFARGEINKEEMDQLLNDLK